MIGHRFRFERPGTIAEAAALLAGAGGRGCVLGGGSVLVPSLSREEAAPDLVIDPARLALDGIREDGADVEIGARATYAGLAASGVVRARLPLLAAMVAEVTGGPGLWNLATLGGAACYANPASDGPGCLTTLGARFRLASVRGERIVPARDFFRGAFETDRAPDEILTGIRVAAQPGGSRHAYLKLKHATSSWPIVTASCLVSEDEGEVRLRLCLGAAAPAPILRTWVRPALPDAAEIASLSREAASGIETEWTDELAGPGYRRAVAATMAARALRAATGAPDAGREGRT